MTDRKPPRERIAHTHAVKATVRIHQHIASAGAADVTAGSAAIEKAVKDLRAAGFDVEAEPTTLTRRPKRAGPTTAQEPDLDERDLAAAD